MGNALKPVVTVANRMFQASSARGPHPLSPAQGAQLEFLLPDEIKLVDDTLRTLSFHAPSQIYDPVMVAKFPVSLPPLHARQTVG